MKRKSTVYSQAYRAKALDLLVKNGGNAKVTAQKLGIPRTTLLDWRDKSDLPVVSHTIPIETRQARIDLWDRVQEAGARRIQELLPTSTDIREVAYAAQIALNAYQDLVFGRKGAEVTIDNRTSSVTLDPATHELMQRTITDRVGGLITIARQDSAQLEEMVEQRPPVLIITPSNDPPGDPPSNSADDRAIN